MRHQNKTPTRQQIFWAGNWPVTIWFVGATSLVTFLIIASAISCADMDLSDMDLSVLLDWPANLVVIGCLVAVVFWSFLVAIVIGSPVLGLVFHWREEKNGGPFEVGDTVQIIVGPHKGRISKVYEIWQGGNLRIVLGDEEEESFRDIFGPTQLLREDDVESTEFE